MPSRTKYQFGLTVNPYPDKQVFHKHRSSTGNVRKFRGFWKYRHTSTEERAKMSTEIETSRWLKTIAPTHRDRQLIFALRCFFPDVDTTVGVGMQILMEPSFRCVMLLWFFSSERKVPNLRWF